MRIIFLIVITFSLFSTKTLGAEEFLLTDQEDFAVQPFTEILKDEDASLTIETASTQAGFKFASDELLTPGYSKSAFWLRTQIRNASERDKTVWLEIGSAGIQSVILYIRRNNAWEKVDAGASIALPHLSLRTRVPLFPITFKAGEKVEVYCRVASVTNISIEPKLWHPLTFLTAESRTSLLYGLLAGGFVAVSTYGAFLFVLMRNRSFLYLAIAAFCFGLYEPVIRGYLALIVPENTAWPVRAMALFGTCSALAMLLYTREFLQVRSRMPKLEKVIWFFIVAFLVSIGISQFGDYHIGSQLSTLTGSLSMLLILFISALAWMRGARDLRFHLIGMGVLTLGAILRNLHIFGWIGPTAGDLSLPIGAVLANTFLLMAVLDKVSSIRKEKAKLQAELLAREQEDHTRLEKAVRNRTTDLQSAMEHAQKANDEKSMLLVYISHDMRAPLSNIVGQAKALRAGEAGDIYSFARSIQKSAQNQLDLIDDLLIHAKGNSDSTKQEHSSFFLYSFIEELAEEGQLLASENGSDFSTAVTENLPPIVSTHKKYLRRILSNLISNAAKFTNDGHVRFDCFCSPGESDEMRYLHFEISDTGAGISSGDIERIFMPFERAESVHRTSGMGLGLAIAQQLALTMNGEINVESTLGEGTCFRFTVPVTLATEADVAINTEQCLDLAENANGELVMVVDDALESRNHIAEILITAGFSVVTAGNGKEALLQLERYKPRLIITDQFMPQMGGWDFLISLSLKKGLKAPPVLLYSGLPPQPPKHFPPQLGFSGSISKPVEATELLRTIQVTMQGIEPSLKKQNHYELSPSVELKELRRMIDDGLLSDIEEWLEMHRDEMPAEFTRQMREAMREVDFVALRRLTKLAHESE